MRTLASRLNDKETSRYENRREFDVTTKEGAIALLKTQGGGNAARVACSELYKQATQQGQGYLPTARISAPITVLRALETIKVIEQATDDRGRAFRFRLTDYGLDMAVKGKM